MECIATPRFVAWLDGLRDLAGRARIQARIERLKAGNPGQHRILAAGVCELKIDAGPGYRVYYVRQGAKLVILLAGGDKSSQESDIRLAIELCRSLQP